MDWTSINIRKKFLTFFEEKGHKIIPSAPMVVKDDPTLMFTNAGMNQFKDLFLGNSEVKDARIADTQKCLRVSGKHNDLEEVGVDTYHHTMFEMLGNWSFGDYFKVEAIDWAWELLVKEYGIDESRLYATVFEGNAKDKLEKDVEAAKCWERYLPVDRILEFDRKDNFWEMGDTGPCGPCSEIHIDLRSDEERKNVPGSELVNKDHPQVIELWNLVFMQYNRLSNGSLENLPAKHVDTGMGFERLCRVLQTKNSNYDSDVFTSLINGLDELTGYNYGSDEGTDIANRVIVDHVRAVAFSIADGQLPSNTGAGYVIRRILRRAIRYNYSYLNMNVPIIYKLVDILCDQLGVVFPELAAQKKNIKEVIQSEEQSFLSTLEKGIKRFKGYTSKGSTKVDGEFAFELYDTFGFPIDLTQLMAKEKKLSVDMEGFQNCLAQQKDRSRKDAATTTGDWVVLIEDPVEEFIGYDQLEAEIMVTRYRKVVAKEKEFYQLVFNLTPFYAEAGGQVGDTGVIVNENEEIQIIDTKKENNLILHYTESLPEKLDATFLAKVNSDKRKKTEFNHSATHLLHEALREILGEHVEQKGSLVNDEHLRFDFSHFQKLESEEIEKIERLVNNRIRSDFDLEERRTVPIGEAKKMGAMALFGEKYGDVVRVIKFGNSVELCGGTHVSSTGKIGIFKIISESAIAAGTRRIEAITADGAEAFISDQLNQLKEIKALLKNPKDLKKGIQNLLKENNDLQKEIANLKKGAAKNLGGELEGKVVEQNGIKFLSERVELDAQGMKDLAFELKGKIPNLFLVLGGESEGKALLTVALDDQLVSDYGLNAGNIVRELATEIQGGGGGQASFATAGGKDPSGLDKALGLAKNYIDSL